MKSASVALKSHLAQNTLTMCLCFKVVREDGQSYFFAGHDRDLVVDGDTYRSDIGFAASETDSKYGLSVDNGEISFPLSDDYLKKSDVYANLFWKSRLDIFWVNWNDLSMGELYEAKGWLLGKAVIKEYKAIFEVRSLASFLDAQILDAISPECPYIFGLNDGFRSKCPITYDDYKSSGTVSVVTSNRIFTGDTYGTEYNNGKITFTSGNNNGYSMEIEDAETDINLFLSMPFDIQAGDTYDIWQGCAKSFAACQAYGVSIDFGGEPNVPSKDEALQYVGPT